MYEYKIDHIKMCHWLLTATKMTRARCSALAALGSYLFVTCGKLKITESCQFMVIHVVIPMAWPNNNAH